MKRDATVKSRMVTICSVCNNAIKYCEKCDYKFELNDKIVCEVIKHYHKDCCRKNPDKKILEIRSQI